MHRKKTRMSLLACLLLAAFLFFSTAAFPAKNDVIKVGLNYDISTVNMLEAKLGVDLPVLLAIYEPLMGADPKTGEKSLTLAESFQVMENQKDIKVTLRKDARFHTGDPVTSQDVKFTYEQCADPSNANLMAGPLDEIEEIEILDDHTLIFRFWEPYAAWKELMWIGICSKNYFDKVGKEKFRKHPVGSGVFRFVERKIGEYIMLEAVQNHYGGNSVNFKTLMFTIIPDELSRMAMLETGELDLISDVLPHQAKRLQRVKHVKVKSTSQVPSLYGVAYRCLTYPSMKDKKLKRAINHAINRQEIVDKIFLGEGYPLYMYASKSELGYDPTFAYEFNPDKARKLLKQSSYKSGTPIIMSYTSAIPNAPLVAVTLQKYLADIGITVKLQLLEAGTQATYARNKDPKEGPMVLFAWAGGRDPSTRLLLSIVSTSIYGGYPNRPNKEEMDKWCTDQAHELDEEKRRAILKQIHEVMIDDPGSTLLFGLNMIYAMSNRIAYSWTPNEAFLFNVYTIRVVSE
jgi:peptide/nickel transport system substrate-binding protein